MQTQQPTVQLSLPIVLERIVMPSHLIEISAEFHVPRNILGLYTPRLVLKDQSLKVRAFLNVDVCHSPL